MWLKRSSQVWSRVFTPKIADMVSFSIPNMKLRLAIPCRVITKTCHDRVFLHIISVWYNSIPVNN